MSSSHPWQDDPCAASNPGYTAVPPTAPLDVFGTGHAGQYATSEPAGYAPSQYQAGYAAQASYAPAPAYAPAAPQPQASSPWAGQAPLTPYQPTAVQHGMALPYHGLSAAPDHPNSGLVLTLGILGVALMFVGLPFAGPFAWWLGSRARREMRESPGRYGPSSGVTTGWVLGIISSVVMALMVALVVGFILLVLLLSRSLG